MLRNADKCCFGPEWKLYMDHIHTGSFIRECIARLGAKSPTWVRPTG